jgi:hypothetical protein
VGIKGCLSPVAKKINPAVPIDREVWQGCKKLYQSTGAPYISHCRCLDTNGCFEKIRCKSYTYEYEEYNDLDLTPTLKEYILLYPNPFQKTISIQWPKITATGITLSIFKITGELVHQATLPKYYPLMVALFKDKNASP